MKPEIGDNSIRLPVTLDFKGGRQYKTTMARNITVALIFVAITVIVIYCTKSSQPVYLKVVLILLGLFLLFRFCCVALFRENYYKKIFRGLEETDGELNGRSLWRIFDIDAQYPYICYFQNGRKGLFVRMERGTITGKGEDAPFYHYDSIGDSYNIAHSCSLNMIHVDYMTGLGRDARLAKAIEEAQKLENPVMRDVMLAMYDNLNEEIATNYSCFDVYLFLSQRVDGFFDSVQTVCERMLGGNYISYSCLPRDEISTLCKDIFNLESFDSILISKDLITATRKGVIPIRVVHPDGTVEELAKTTKQREEEAERRRAEIEARKEQEKALRNFSKKRDKTDDKNLVDF